VGSWIIERELCVPWVWYLRMLGCCEPPGADGPIDSCWRWDSDASRIERFFRSRDLLQRSGRATPGDRFFLHFFICLKYGCRLVLSIIH
jgi:hypothetical protein